MVVADSMEKTLEQTFTENLQKGFDISALGSEAQNYLKDLSKHQKSDFASNTGGYFSQESESFIARESAERLAKALTSYQGKMIGRPEIQDEWQKIVGDFYRSQYWDQPTQKQKPPKVLTEDQKRTREIFPYIWAAFQAWIVMKLVISYFGIESADNPDETPWFLYIALAFSFGSLIFFAWRKSRKGE